MDSIHNIEYHVLTQNGSKRGTVKTLIVTHKPLANGQPDTL